MRAAVLHNVDFEHYAADAASLAADAEVQETAANVARGLARRGVEAHILTVDDDTAPLIEALRAFAPDVVFNLVESLGGDTNREPEIPELLDTLGLVYTGNSPGILRVAHDKDATRRLLAARGVGVPRGITAVDLAAAEAALAGAGLGFPLFVKPALADASIGIDQASIVRDAAALARKLEAIAAEVPGPYVIEEYLPGREVNVAIFPEPVAGHYVCTDIDFSECDAGFAPIVTYDCKWTPGTPDYKAKSLPSRGRLPDAEIAAAQAIARDAYLALGGTGYGRVDLRTGDDGRLYVIDVNPNPDINSDAGLAIAARSIGVEHDELVMLVVEAALRRAGKEVPPWR